MPLSLPTGVKAVAPQHMTCFDRLVARHIRDRFGLRPNTAGLRYTLLLCTIAVVFSGYFSYDLPGIMSEELKRVMHTSNSELGLLFSVYALPNAFVPLLCGMLYARTGAWGGVLMISCVICAGIVVVAFGAAAHSLWLMVLGRLLYGVVGDSLYVGVDVLATAWFKENELGLAYGLIQSAGQAGSFAAFYGIPALVIGSGTFVTGFVLGTLVAAGALVTLFIGYTLERVTATKEGDVNGNASGPLSDADVFRIGGVGKDFSASETVDAAAGRAGLQKRGGGGAHHSANSSQDTIDVTDQASGAEAGESAALLSQQHARAPSPPLPSPLGSRGTCYWHACNRCLNQPLAVQLGMHHMTTLSWQFYCVLVAIAAYSGCFYTFLAFGNDYLQTRYGMGMEESGHMVGMISISSAVLSPLAGYIMDKRGGKEQAAVVCMALACISFTLLGFTTAPVVPVIALAGLSYAVLPCALYPLIADTVPDEAFTQVYAITNAAVNAVLMMSFFAAGTLSDVQLMGEGVPAPSDGSLEVMPPKANYRPVFYLFTGFTAIGTLATAMLVYSPPVRGHHRGSENDLTGRLDAGSSSAVSPHDVALVLDDVVTPGRGNVVRRTDVPAVVAVPSHTVVTPPSGRMAVAGANGGVHV